MKQALTILFLCCAFSSFGQQKNTVSNEVIEAIRDDIWIPFMESYEELNPDKLKSVHSKDIVRIRIEQNQIETGEKYLKRFGSFLQRTKQDSGKTAIAFAILSTAIDESTTIAYQTGYYRYSLKRKDEAELSVRGYGYFTVGLKKESGTWKIWIDSDKQTDISEKDFQAQEILYELMK